MASIYSFVQEEAKQGINKTRFNNHFVISINKDNALVKQYVVYLSVSHVEQIRFRSIDKDGQSCNYCRVSLQHVAMNKHSTNLIC